MERIVDVDDLNVGATVAIVAALALLLADACMHPRFCADHLEQQINQAKREHRHNHLCHNRHARLRRHSCAEDARHAACRRAVDLDAATTTERHSAAAVADLYASASRRDARAHRRDRSDGLPSIDRRHDLAIAVVALCVVAVVSTIDHRCRINICVVGHIFVVGFAVTISRIGATFSLPPET